MVLEWLGMCHHLKQGGKKQGSRYSLLIPALLTRESKEGEVRETFNLEIKTALLIVLIREIMQNIQTRY